MRLIDADNVNPSDVFIGISDFATDARIAVCELLRNQPTVDAVPVVRCGECKHRGTDDCPMHIKGVPADEGFLKVVDNDFCSHGERRSK